MTSPYTFDGQAMSDDLHRLLRLKTTPICMKLFERVDDIQPYGVQMDVRAGMAVSYGKK